MFGAIVSGIASIGSAIAGALSTAGTFIAGVATRIGPAASKFAESFLSVVARIPKIDFETFKTVIDIAGKIIHTICDALGINSEDDPEILGAKAQQAEKPISEFDNDIEAYIKYLKNEIELDKEKFEKMSAEERMGCKAIGLALETKAVEDKIGGVVFSPEYVATLAKIQLGTGLAMTAKDLIDIINSLKSAGITNLNDVKDYLEGSGDSDRIKTGEALRGAIEKIDTIEDSSQTIEDMKQAVRKFEE